LKGNRRDSQIHRRNANALGAQQVEPRCCAQVERQQLCGREICDDPLEPSIATGHAGLVAGATDVGVPAQDFFMKRNDGEVKGGRRLRRNSWS
jgi:hypothetical protein